MYGLVNRALEEHVILRWGEGAWAEIKRRAGVDVEVFLTHEPYPDEITVRLVVAAQAVLGVPADTILEGFGEHWVLETARRGYGALLTSTGSSLAEFLENLPHLHTRVLLLFPRLRPPDFHVERAGEGAMRLAYASHREGLAPFVVGLLRGLGEMFGQPVTVEHVERRAAGAKEDVFLVRWDAQPERAR